MSRTVELHNMLMVQILVNLVLSGGMLHVHVVGR